MGRFRDFVARLLAPLAGLEDILKKVRGGQLAPDDAARQIRRLASAPHIPPWAPRLLRIIGAGFMAIGIGLAAYSVVFSLGAKETQGTVIDMVGGDGQSPIVEYRVDGKRFTLQSSISSKPPAYFVGERVPVLYRPGNPRRAQINSFTDRWLFPVVFSCGGTLAVVLSFLLPRIFRWVLGSSLPNSGLPP